MSSQLLMAFVRGIPGTEQRIDSFLSSEPEDLCYVADEL
jgi:hypothetical protein